MTLEMQNLGALSSYSADTASVGSVDFMSADDLALAAGCLGTAGTAGTLGTACGCAGTLGSFGTYGSYGSAA